MSARTLSPERKEHVQALRYQDRLKTSLRRTERRSKAIERKAGLK